jgi:hypothetical protein
MIEDLDPTKGSRSMRGRPQFGHILRTKPVPGRSWIARKTNIEMMQLPQIHSRSPNCVP